MLAYLDTPSGISGDMFLGCLVDAGWSIDALLATITKLNVPSDRWSIRAEAVMRGPMRATLVHVDVATEHVHRHLRDVRAIIEGAELPPVVRERAVAVFTRLAKAEAHVHGSTVEEVHFHEVGALDAIIDIVGVCAGLHALSVDQLYASGLPLSEGWTMTEHGRIPLPAPATLTLLANAQATTRRAPGPGELVTPTGAALLAEFAIFEQPLMRLMGTGIGAGQKEFEWPNVARLWLGESVAASKESSLVQLETNIDDMNPELYNAVQDQLFAAGALDVWTTPIQMKKNRPATLLSVLARADQEDALADIILRETTTLGVRVHKLHRHEAEREAASVDTIYGSIKVKLKRVAGVVQGVKPEYDDCRRVAGEQELPVRMVIDAAQAAAHAHFIMAES